MHERIKELRKALNLTQQAFADALKIGRGTLANYEVGRNEPLDAVISLICKEFEVNETWLRTGEGDMFVQVTHIQEIADFMSSLLSTEPDDFKRRFILMLSRLTEEEWRFLAKMAEEMAKG